MEQLQGMDASFVALETPNSPMHIGSILIYDPSTAPGGFVRFKDILRFFESRLPLSKTVRQKLVRVPFSIDYPYWVEDPNFDLEYHVRHVALPEPGDWRQLCILAARIFARPLDLTRPPWEFTVVGGLDNIPGIPKGSYAMITKVHHAAIDGMSGIDLMQALHTPTPSVEAPGIEDTWKPDRSPNRLGLFARGYARAWLNPVRQWRVAAQSVPGMYRAARGLVRGDFGFKAAMSAPRTRFNARVTPHRVVEGQTFALADIKALRGLSEGAKVNDVMLAIIGGALNKYLTHYGELPKTSMTAMAPISVRTEDESNSMGNQVSAMIVPLGSHISDPLERLEFVHAETRKSKEMTNAIGARQLTEASKVSPALFMALGARLYSSMGMADWAVRPVINTVVTNVPGPPVPIYSAGARLVSMHGLLCLLDGMTLGHVVQSYVDQATITFTADREAMPDPDFYTRCLRESFEELAACAGLDVTAPAATVAAQSGEEAPAEAPARAVGARSKTGKTRSKSVTKKSEKAQTSRRNPNRKAAAST